MSFDYIISEICNLRIGEVILIGNNTTLLDYGHQFIGSFHTMDSKCDPKIRLVVIYIRY